MYLKSVDIVGYKSFATKTRLELQPGITGIIGPNGCGKSNIMESVRWCLGEMSWKSLRADSMVDVIFAGTAKRSPLSMTEVTLVFDNASNMLPVQFSEVTVSRRIFRSGESEYYLNKTQCRLRDIRELFLDTGVGGDGYAIIDQGGVEFVISSKPEDRRALFEEAAGVAKYKAKREEAIRKLERVEVDMGRLQDSVALIEDQVRKLDSAARKAKLYKKYKEDLAVLESNHVVEQLAQIEKDLAALTELVRPVEERLGARKTELTAENANKAALDLERANQNNLVVAANQKVAEAKTNIGILQERITSAQHQIEDFGKRRADCEAELSHGQARMAQLDPEIDQAKKDLDAALVQLEECRKELEGVDGRVAEAEAALAAAKGEAEELSRQATGIRQENLEQSRALNRRESDLSHKGGEIRGYLKNLAKEQGQIQVCQNELDAANKAFEEQIAKTAASRGAVEANEAQAAESRRRLSELNEETQRLHSDLVTAKAKAEALQAQGEQNPYWAGAQAVLTSGIAGIVGTVRQLIQVPEEFRLQLEDALGDRLYAVVCEDSKAAKDAVEFLNASDKGRARFLVLNSLPQALPEKSYPDEARPLLRGIGFDAKHENAVRFLLQESYLLGKTLFGDHWVSGGSAPRERQASLADIGEIRASISSLETLQAERAAQRTGLLAETETKERLAREAVEAFNSDSATEKVLRSRLEQKESALQNGLTSSEMSTNEAASTLAEMALAMEEINSLRRAIRENEARVEEFQKKEVAASEKTGLLKEDLTHRQASRNSFSDKVRHAEEVVKMKETAFGKSAMEKESLEAQLARRTAELSDLAAKKEEAILRETQAREELKTGNEALLVVEASASAAFARLGELNHAVEGKERTIRLLQTEVDEATAVLHKHQLELGQHKSRQEMLRTNLWDTWSITYEEAKGKYTGEAVDMEKLETLRKRVANMGDINMGAPEEYEELSTKLCFLANQIEDLKKAKEDLTSAIAKINASTRENFRQTFTEVREQFRRLYGVLFEGGEADLVLEDPENILETGIEIKAQPPGKRLQSISLLSGGEKTLTAIALLFAFFMVKPSPFCMLDEADAALDDANIGRFVALLKEFQSRSQFLIVSHNKKTMEAADVIYGVTMEEMGVSQLISVDFRKKEKAAPAPIAAQAAPETSDNPA